MVVVLNAGCERLSDREVTLERMDEMNNGRKERKKGKRKKGERKTKPKNNNNKLNK